MYEDASETRKSIAVDGGFLSSATAEAYAEDLIRVGKADTLWAVCEKPE